jgi:hypothetical protein
MNRPRCLERGDAVVDSTGQPALPDCSSLRTSYTSARHLMVGGLVVTGALAATAATLWLIDWRRSSPGHPPETARAWGCAPAPARLGLACATTF